MCISMTKLVSGCGRGIWPDRRRELKVEVSHRHAFPDNNQCARQHDWLLAIHSDDADAHARADAIHKLVLALDSHIDLVAPGAPSEYGPAPKDRADLDA